MQCEGEFIQRCSFDRSNQSWKCGPVCSRNIFPDIIFLDFFQKRFTLMDFILAAARRWFYSHRLMVWTRLSLVLRRPSPIINRLLSPITLRLEPATQNLAIYFVEWSGWVRFRVKVSDRQNFASISDEIDWTFLKKLSWVLREINPTPSWSRGGGVATINALILRVGGKTWYGMSGRS